MVDAGLDGGGGIGEFGVEEEEGEGWEFGVGGEWGWGFFEIGWEGGVVEWGWVWEG